MDCKCDVPNEFILQGSDITFRKALFPVEPMKLADLAWCSLTSGQRQISGLFGPLAQIGTA